MAPCSGVDDEDVNLVAEPGAMASKQFNISLFVAINHNNNDHNNDKLLE